MSFVQTIRSSLYFFFVTSAFLFNSVHSVDTCSTIARAHPEISTLYSQLVEYNVTLKDYWSTACSALKPSCILLPRSAQQVSDILKVLGQNDEPFAVKSGGHSPNKYFASIAGGPLISTKLLNEVNYNALTETVRVGPGNHWHNVSFAMQGTGRNAIGGRMGDVGVGGYLLGGGLGFLSAEHGWAANHILEAEVVLANATIVKASNTSNPDLLAAIKGGGGNFGIVTSFTLRTFPQDNVWGGIRLYTGGNTPALLAAIRDYTENNKDVKAGIIPTAEVTGANFVNIWFVFFFYNGPKPPKDVFAKFMAIPSLVDTTKTRTYDDLVRFNNNFVIRNSIYTIATETMPLPNATVGAEVMQGIYDTWHKVATSVGRVPGAVASIAWQPMPKAIIQASNQYGGIVLDLDDSADRIIIELDYSYFNSADDAQAEAATVKTYTDIKDKVEGYIEAGKLPDVHLPLFMNDCYHRQDYWGRLKNKDRYMAIREKVDPEGFWKKRTKGFAI
ncbi:putative FAD dependent oxidoreductase [Tothia fuscella]|uniref:FAD dependent oxidoreductase n=1 Tax=Tothia fuscella TaxID=1048955 RepID=A0A9P4NTB4_9PEZI|nr:putative FAD dependent oxidoreductase [Tothia fuscella]